MLTSQPEYDGLPRAIDLPNALRAQLDAGVELSAEERGAYEAIAASDIAGLGVERERWLAAFKYRSAILDRSRDEKTRRRRRAAAIAAAALLLHADTGEPVLHGTVKRDRFVPDDRRHKPIASLLQGRIDALFLARELGRLDGVPPM